jgi:hypothetical protein
MHEYCIKSCLRRNPYGIYVYVYVYVYVWQIPLSAFYSKSFATQREGLFVYCDSYRKRKSS